MKNHELLNAQKELLAHSYGHAQAYTTVVLLAGYAGFFAVWTFLKQDLSKEQVFSSGLLIALSLSSYIIWEVYQSFYRSRTLLGLNKAIQNPDNFEILLAAHKKNEQERLISFGRVWVFVFWFTVSTGFSAVSILIYAFIDTLWTLYTA